MADRADAWPNGVVAKVDGSHLTFTSDPLVWPLTLEHEHVDSLCDLLGDQKIKSLKFECFFEDVFCTDDFDRVATAIVSNKSITHMEIKNAELLFNSENGVEQIAFADAIKKILGQGSLVAFELRQGMLDDMEEISDYVWTAFAAGIEQSPSLESLKFSIRMGGIGRRGCHALARIINNNKRIKRLVLDACCWMAETEVSKVTTAIASSNTLTHFSANQACFGTEIQSDVRAAHHFYTDLEAGVFDNCSLRSAVVLPQIFHPARAEGATRRLNYYVGENNRVRVACVLVFMFCLREAPDGSPLSLIRGFPFRFEEFPLIRYIEEAYHWAPRRAQWTPLPAPDNKRKDAPGDAEGQSAAKRAK